ncbi:MAG TPA: shikimate dehydrogenase [Solirubrobacterales bacterium]|nr:shikimate dehydrogenase [Solirubrobacterales bacterium]
MPRLAVIGFPVGHSRSPAMQNAALASLGLAPEWIYEAVEVAPEDFEAKVAEMAADGFAGANVTIPHKEAALRLASGTSEAAREIGAANTLSFSAPRAGEGGADAAGIPDLPEIDAENTDAGGLLAALPTTPLDARTLVLGAGGAARAAVWALVGEGARVEVWNRTAARAQELSAQLGGKAVASPEQADYDLIVNTTAVGLRGEDPFVELPLERDGFAGGQLVVDMVYGEGRSALLEAAAAAGASTIDGLEILVHQGALSLEIWTGRKPDLDVMRSAARA